MNITSSNQDKRANHNTVFRLQPSWWHTLNKRQLVQWGIVFAVLLLMLSAQALAQNNILPSGDAGFQIPGTTDSDSWIKKMVYAFVFVIILLALLGLGYGIVSGIWRMFMVSDDARTQDEGIMNVIKKIGGIVVIIVFCVVLFMVINKVVIEPLYKMFG